MRSLRLVPLAVAVAALSIASPAAADPSQKEWAEWKQLVEAGKKAMREGQPAAAVDTLRRADAIHKSPSLDVDLATALAAAGKLVEARALFLRVSQSSDPSILWKRARDAAKKALADLEPRVPTLRVTVSGASGASVTVDGQKIATGSDSPFDPGNHTIVASADGYRTIERTVNLGAGKHDVISLDMVASGTSAPAAAPEEKSTGSRVPGIVLLSVGGAALVAGGVFGGLAFSAVSDAKAVCKGTSCPASAAADIDRSKTFGNVSTGLFIGGGLVAVVGIILTAVAPGGTKAEPAKDAIHLSPFVGPGSAGVTGRF